MRVDGCFAWSLEDLDHRESETAFAPIRGTPMTISESAPRCLLLPRLESRIQSPW
jgi:hypothetical protein